MLNYNAFAIRILPISGVCGFSRFDSDTVTRITAQRNFKGHVGSNIKCFFKYPIVV